MASEWVEKSLGDLIEIKHGFAFKGEFFREEPPGDILLTPGNFQIGGGFKSEKLKYYDGPVDEEFILQEGDLIVTMTDLSKNADTLGYPAFVPKANENRRYLHNQRLGKIIIKDKDSISLKYLYYLLCTQEYRSEVIASATGTTVKHTSPERIKAFRFRVPPLSEQRAIAHILGTLDDKIELNRRMCETLEEMARALFKSWFVDFDLVRFKMRHPSPTGRGVRGEGVKSEKPPLPENLLQFAREMRKKATDAETLLWQLLRNRQLAGSKFRRQHPFPPYILDFYCNELRLAIEVDGGHHTNSEIQRYDQRRTAFLEENGIRVLRFWDNEVLKDTEAVLQAIYEAVEGRKEKLFPSPPSPLPFGEGKLLSGCFGTAIERCTCKIEPFIASRGP